MNRWLWAPVVAAVFAAQGFISWRSNDSKALHWFWIGWVLQCLPMWQLVARGSKDLVFDGLLFDVVLTVAYTVMMAWCTGALFTLRWVQWAGLVLAMAGMFLFKRGG